MVYCIHVYCYQLYVLWQFSKHIYNIMLIRDSRPILHRKIGEYSTTAIDNNVIRIELVNNTACRLIPYAVAHNKQSRKLFRLQNVSRHWSHHLGKLASSMISRNTEYIQSAQLLDFVYGFDIYESVMFNSILVLRLSEKRNCFRQILSLTLGS